MSTAEKNRNAVELTISGHQISLTFAAEQNLTVAQQIRASLIDSFIRQHEVSGSIPFISTKQTTKSRLCGLNFLRKN